MPDKIISHPGEHVSQAEWDRIFQRQTGEMTDRAWQALKLRSLFDLPEQEEERVSYIFLRSALADCGDCWSSVLCWYNENDRSIYIPSDANVPWY